MNSYPPEIRNVTELTAIKISFSVFVTGVVHSEAGFEILSWGQGCQSAGVQ